ncbi:MAG: hypothetical protein IPM48_07315 [Saprospiraceae bacterium]|nr:hypothetical protein [Saprospiraceae bacterium]
MYPRLIIFGLYGIVMSIQCGSDKKMISKIHDSPVEERKRLISKVLLNKYPILNLPDIDKDPVKKMVSNLVMEYPGMQEFYFEKESNKPMLSEIFSISALRASDPLGGNAKCAGKNCWRLEIYHYASNGMLLAIVDVDQKKVLDFNYFKGFQPDLPPHLGELAIWIAAHDSTVIREYGGLSPLAGEAKMPSTKTALNNTKCQRSMHLCVAPTFVKGNKALWSIVDLTEMKVAGVKWTEVGITGMAVTERLLQNEKMMSAYCEVENHGAMDGWEFDYTLTRSDGLRIRNIRYLGRQLFDDVKMVDWHVSYSNTDGFGYSDAIGCPEYSQAAVIAIEAPFFESILDNEDTIGFALVQKYFSEGWPTPCSYNYQQNFEFYRNGSFRPVVGSLGRGCGNDGTYRPVTRIAIAGNNNTFQQFKQNNWKSWDKEQWDVEDELSEYSEDKYFGRILYKDKPWLIIEAAKGQFNDGGRGDRAYYYITKRHLDRNEGESDLPTIGPCCNTDFRQGPEKFIESPPENILNSGLVLWYVPQLKNDNAKGSEYCWAESVLENGIYVAKVYPCFSGLKFHLNQ